MKKNVRISRAKLKAKKHPDERKAISMVKLVGVSMKLREHNNHLQGLYAELGKVVFDQHLRLGSGTPRRWSAVMTGLAGRIEELRKKMTLLEREVKTLKKAA
jgi:hypothetical protein